MNYLKLMVQCTVGIRFLDALNASIKFNILGVIK